MIPRFQSTDSSNVHLIDGIRFQDPPGTQKRLTPNRLASFLLVSVKQGGVDVFFGGGDPGGRLCPDLHFGQTNAPVWVPLPLGQFELTCVAVGATGLTVLASVWLGGP